MERAGGKVVQRMTVRGWFTKWLDEKVADGGIGENSRIAYSATIRHFLQNLEGVWKVGFGHAFGARQSRRSMSLLMAR